MLSVRFPVIGSFSCGVNLFAFDSAVELEKIARSAPGAEVFCRILTSNEGAEWPLSRKFGCDTNMAGDLIVRAAELGLKPRGISFHVGSQQTDPTQWDDALFETRKLFDRVKAEAGIDLDLVNLGGGFPSRYDKEVPGCKDGGLRRAVLAFGSLADPASRFRNFACLGRRHRFHDPQPHSHRHSRRAGWLARPLCG